MVSLDLEYPSRRDEIVSNEVAMIDDRETHVHHCVKVVIVTWRHCDYHLFALQQVDISIT